MREARLFWFVGALALTVVPSRVSRAQYVQTASEDDVEPEARAAPAPETPPASAAPGAFHFELAARGTYASPPVRGGLNPLGFGGGAGLDFIFSHVVVGASVIGYGGASADSGASESAILFGGELGYELHLTPIFAIRPMFGAGAGMITDTIPTASASVAATPAGVGTRASPASAVDVVTQATSISSGGGGGGRSAPSSTSTVVGALYLAPGILTTIATSPGSFLGVGGRVLYFPNVAYGYDSSARWLAYSLDVNVGLRF